MQDVKCGCGIPSDVEWFDAILDIIINHFYIALFSALEQTHCARV